MMSSSPLRFFLMMSCFAILALSCAGSRDVPVPSQTVDVGCGRCIFAMEEAQGCPWAAEIGGKPYLMLGTIPEDHVNHSATGICNMRRQARVEGFIRQDRFVANSLELLPATNVPASPTFTEKDLH